MQPSQPVPSFNRRRFLEFGATAGALALARPAWAMVEEQKTRRVILIAFAGGVRTRETFGTPENVPNLQRLADEGVYYPKMRTANRGHFGAALSIFTGVGQQRGIRENGRGPEPTLFEYLRKDAGLSAGDVWITTSGGPQQVNYSHGTHTDYGPKYAANTLDGDGIFNREFKSVLTSLGKPREMPEAEKGLLEKIREAMDPDSDDAENTARVEEYILAELTRGTSDVRGANAGDGKALRVARNLIALFKPKLTAVVLQNADTAHGSYNGYVEVIRRNDAAIGEIVETVTGDPDLAESTAIFVLPEFGRDRDLNSRRGLDHGDGSDDLNFVGGLAWGPDFARGRVVQDEVRTIDVMPTICELFGTRAKRAKGKRLAKLG
ncbi:MAG: hypothetical protein ABGY71_10570 [bacterium]|jgi:hypothetical protein|nr:hypothetical protein [Planctomycetota bacterium]HIL51036.1 hypothetical protein [Planctomycetota bacterium]